MLQSLSKGMLFRCLIALIAVSGCAAYCQQFSAAQALKQAVDGTPAIAVVLDVKRGRTLAVERTDEASALRSTPGSTLKPFFLAYALEHGLVQPQAAVYCRRTLRIAGRNVDCTHPQSETVFNAELALAYSCNSYFVELAKRFSPDNANEVLREYGINNGVPEQVPLFVLGLEGVAVAPDTLARAYGKLASHWTGLPDAVRRGLEESVQFGMAHNAYVAGLHIAGKTGTSSDPGQPWTHGWFAGIAPADHPKIAVVLYIPHGNGADAARIAQRFFAGYKDALR